MSDLLTISEICRRNNLSERKVRSQWFLNTPRAVPKPNYIKRSGWLFINEDAFLEWYNSPRAKKLGRPAYKEFKNEAA